MSESFLKVVNMSISAGWLVLAVLALRLILKKAPKWVNVLLWGIVAVRLICPFSIESALSLIPSAETISPEIMMDPTPGITSGIPSLNSAINPIISGSFAPNPGDSANPLQILIPMASYVWILGILLMLLYTIGSYVSLRQQLRIATPVRENIYQCVTVDSPFVLGILKPKIYLPYEMKGENLNHVVAHEQAHIRRKDHLWKPLGFLLLTIHWFNPLMWIAYILLCRDIELACDEKVIAEFGNDQRADYTQALVACSVNRRIIAACPLAFGEVSVKERVKNVLNYKKPGFWIVIAAVVVCIAVAVCFLTDPETKQDLSFLNYENLVAVAAQSDTHPASKSDDQHSYIIDGTQLAQLLDTANWTAQTGISRNVQRYTDQHSQVSIQITLDGIYLRVFDTDTANIYDSTTGKDRYYRMDRGDYEKLLSMLRFDHDGSNQYAPMVINWFDYLENLEEMNWDKTLEISLPEFPDVTFRYNPYEIVAAKGEEVYRLYAGMPIWNTYFCDLTGDGLPDFCSTLSFGSGMIDNRVIIYDYANGVSYELSDRGYHDYSLRLNEADGRLYVDKTLYPNGEAIASGPLVYRDGCIQVEGVSTDRTTVPDVTFGGNLNLGLNGKIVDIDPFQRILYVTDLDQSANVFGDRCAIDCTYAISRYNLLYVNYGDPNDVRTIDFSALGVGDAVIIGMYDSELEKAFNGSAVAEQVQLATQKYGSTVAMVPTETKMKGLCAGALLLPLDDGTYRYLLKDSTPNGVTADDLLFSFDETDIGEPIHHEVYSLKEYPDRSKVLLITDKNGAWLCEYSPPQRCSDTALSDAIAAGYAVMEDGNATTGHDVWQNFYEQIQNGTKASVTVAHYYTLNPAQWDSVYYEVFQQDYPCLYLNQLSYDGNQFTLTTEDGGTRNYEYLLKYETPRYSIQSSQKPEPSYKYVLTNDNSYTYEELLASVASSYYGAYIDHYTIYSEPKQ